MLSITEIINDIPNRAEIPQCKSEFSTLISSALQNGDALLLIDGLDEITEDKNRVTFVNQLRTFIATYPSISIIVTSREAGFRVVAGSLATYCSNYSISNLSSAEIETLCLKWHKAVIDDSDNTHIEAKKLSELILKDNRIRVLAENPLLLTTLLFVKRWAGYLPTKSIVLYQEMIKLLLVTWNVEGHEILDIEEAEPQLAYVAYWMTKNGLKIIDAEQLIECLVEVRKLLPEILGYTKISPTEFIKRVELRSSLLIMSGHRKLESGNIVAVYEFLHLSFQEYLTAKAIVKKYITREDVDKDAVDILKININNESWKEVIPLCAVLMERNSKIIVEYLIHKSKEIAEIARAGRRIRKGDLAPDLLGSCLANEIQISPEVLDNAIEWYAKCKYSHRSIKNYNEVILNNKFGESYKKRISHCLFNDYDDMFFGPLGSTLSDIFIIEFKAKNDIKTDFISYVNDILVNSDRNNKCIAILGLMQYMFELHRSPNDTVGYTHDISVRDTLTLMKPLLITGDFHYIYSICWCILWIGKVDIFPKELRDEFANILIEYWIRPNQMHMQRMISWALTELLSSNSIINDSLSIPIKKLISEKRNLSSKVENENVVLVMLGTITGEKFTKNELNDVFKIYIDTKQSNNIAKFVKELYI